jgi:hypothetical protein
VCPLRYRFILAHPSKAVATWLWPTLDFKRGVSCIVEIAVLLLAFSIFVTVCVKIVVLTVKRMMEKSIQAIHLRNTQIVVLHVENVGMKQVC